MFIAVISAIAVIAVIFITRSVKVVPQQPTEFTCRNCYLVKHRSQLADKKRMLCRDCA